MQNILLKYTADMVCICRMVLKYEYCVLLAQISVSSYTLCYKRMSKCRSLTSLFGHCFRMTPPPPCCLILYFIFNGARAPFDFSVTIGMGNSKCLLCLQYLSCTKLQSSYMSNQCSCDDFPYELDGNGN